MGLNDCSSRGCGESGCAVVGAAVESSHSFERWGVVACDCNSGVVFDSGVIASLTDSPADNRHGNGIVISEQSSTHVEVKRCVVETADGMGFEKRRLRWCLSRAP
jgi:hypothetical protein